MSRRSLLALVDDLSVDHVAGFLVRRGAGVAGGAVSTGGAARRAGAGALRLPVQRLGGLVLRGRERLQTALDGFRILPFDRLFQVLDGAFDRLPVGRTELVAGVLEHALSGVARLIRAVARLDLVPPLLVFLGVRFGLLHHPIDFVLREAARRRDRDLLFLARAQILRL